jgi:SCY1-like protein 2
MQVGADILATNVVPMVVRAFEDPDARMQEEVLKRTLTLTKQLDFTVSPLNLCQVFQILEL